MSTYTVFSDNALTTVAAGGFNGGAAQADAPSPGTSQTWTVASSSSFPSLGTGQIFNVIDPAQPTEVISVTNVSGTTWTVVRGSESTTPTKHGVGCILIQTVSASDFGSFVQNFQPAAVVLGGISAPSATSGDATFYATTNGTPGCVNGPGFGGELIITQSDTTLYTNSSGSTSVTQVSNRYSIPAGDIRVGTIYRLTVLGSFAPSGNQNASSWYVNFASNTTAVTIVSFSASALTVSHVYPFRAVCEVVGLTTGSSGTCFVSGSLNIYDVTGGLQPNVFVSNSSAFTTNTTTSNNFGLNQQWGTTAGTPTVNSYCSYLERIAV